MRHCYIILLFIITISSCKKVKDIEPVREKLPDTIKPGSYFPGWPGSWWKYNRGGGVFQTDSTKIAWKLHQYDYNSNLGTTTLSDQVYVPFLNNEPIYGYRRLVYVKPPLGDYYQSPQFLSEEIGKTLSDNDFCDSRNGNPCPEETKKVISKGVNSKGDSILILKGQYAYRNLNNQHWIDNPPNEITYREYTKNVGLTLHYIYDTIKKDTTFMKRLVDFKIGAH